MLTIENLSKTYANGVQALRGVSLDIPRGMFGLLGPNGAGKSTLMRTLATLQDPDRGTIRFGALDVLHDKHELRKQLGYLPQDVGVYPGISAEGLLDHFALLKGITEKGERRDEVIRLLQMTNLYEARKRRLGTYSGGMRRRFGIAQALLGNPELIIVDEPTAGLDPEERNRFHNLLCEIGESAVVILSTHIVEDVRELCKRMAILARGQILTQGTPEELVAALQGQVWSTTVDRSQASEYQERYTVLFTRLTAGRSIVHALASEPPAPEFQATAPDLEHVYFAALRSVSTSPALQHA
jgi:ABC-type multidrug transport system ATPase subunit